jgi:hypothetical protein
MRLRDLVESISAKASRRTAPQFKNQYSVARYQRSEWILLVILVAIVAGLDGLLSGSIPTITFWSWSGAFVYLGILLSAQAVSEVIYDFIYYIANLPLGVLGSSEANYRLAQFYNTKNDSCAYYRRLLKAANKAHKDAAYLIAMFLIANATDAQSKRDDQDSTDSTYLYKTPENLPELRRLMNSRAIIEYLRVAADQGNALSSFKCYKPAFPG